MAKIRFIQARGGLSTTERLLQIIAQNPHGLTLKSLSKEMNRPVSMLNICLNSLIKTKQVKVKLSDNKMQKIYSISS